MRRSRVRRCLTATLVAGTICCLDAAGSQLIGGGGILIGTAGAVVGRPATPVSVAGVARRTVTPGVGAPGVGVAPGVGAPGVGAPGVPSPGVGGPANRGGPVDRPGRR